MEYIVITDMKELSIDVYKDLKEAANHLNVSANILKTKLLNDHVIMINHSIVGYGLLHKSNRGKSSSGRF